MCHIRSTAEKLPLSVSRIPSRTIPSCLKWAKSHPRFDSLRSSKIQRCFGQIHEGGEASDGIRAAMRAGSQPECVSFSLSLARALSRSLSLSFTHILSLPQCPPGVPFANPLYPWSYLYSWSYSSPLFSWEKVTLLPAHKQRRHTVDDKIPRSHNVSQNGRCLMKFVLIRTSKNSRH